MMYGDGGAVRASIWEQSDNQLLTVHTSIHRLFLFDANNINIPGKVTVDSNKLYNIELYTCTFRFTFREAATASLLRSDPSRASLSLCCCSRFSRYFANSSTRLPLFFSRLLTTLWRRWRSSCRCRTISLVLGAWNVNENKHEKLEVHQH